ncbi:MAG: YigZ family protein [Eubacterium sp.]|nr:YigZ family protein [Eubacterium sp.]
MSEQYKTVHGEGSGEIEEKKSRFIATLRHVETPEEAAAFYEEMRKKYWDARHNCTACIIGRQGEYRHSSDDGEPSGTAGRPMLEVLSGAGLTDTAAVVTRYFGGTLLGTGGLVRAYSAAMQQGLQNTEILEKRLCVCLQITTDYNGVGKLQYLFAQREVQILDSVYEHDVRFRIAVPPEEQKSITAAVADATAGRAAVEEEGTDWY